MDDQDKEFVEGFGCAARLMTAYADGNGLPHPLLKDFAAKCVRLWVEDDRLSLETGRDRAIHTWIRGRVAGGESAFGR